MNPHLGVCSIMTGNNIYDTAMLGNKPWDVSNFLTTQRPPLSCPWGAAHQSKEDAFSFCPFFYSHLFSLHLYSISINNPSHPTYPTKETNVFCCQPPAQVHRHCGRPCQDHHPFLHHRQGRRLGRVPHRHPRPEHLVDPHRVVSSLFRSASLSDSSAKLRLFAGFGGVIHRYSC